MKRQRIGVTAEFRAAAAILGIGILFAMVLWGAGCSRAPSEYSQLSPNGEGFLFPSIRPAAGDTTRLLQNAHYLKLMGRSELALRELEAAYQQDPGNVRVLNALALACDEMGEFSRAQKLYQEALALDVSNQALHNNLCFSYYLAGQWDKAESCFRQALNKNPQNLMARNNLGLLLCRRGRTEEARRLWLEAEGEMAAQKKMQQVMVALGLGETSHYAQLPQTAPVASAPLPKTSTPSPVLAPAAIPAKVALPSAPAPQPQVPVARPAKAREPLKLAADHSPPAAQPDKKPTPVIAAKPAPPQPKEPVAAMPAPVKPAPPKPLAKSNPPVAQHQPASPGLAPAPKAPSPPAPPKQAAGTDKKPTPATSPPPPAKPGKIKVGATPVPVRLTGEQLTKSGIEIANGSGGSNLARQTRAMLSEEGFKVVAIGNHRDFGAENTVIYYHPGSEEVARALNAKFFPKSRLEIGEKFAGGADIKVLLGKDRVEPAALADKSALMADKIAAGPVPSPQESKPVAAAPAPVAARPQTPAPAPAAADTAKVADRVAGPKFLTAEELETMAVEIRNGTAAPDLARKARTMLSQEGFNVARIGNHIDFGAEKTVIFYRAGAEKIARNLSAKFFANSPMEQSTKLSADVAVKVLLGKDLIQRTEVMAKLDD